MVVGENGVLNRAKDASSSTADAQAKEALSIAISGMQGTFANKIADGTATTFIAFLKEQDAATVQKEMNGYTIEHWGEDGKGVKDTSDDSITVVMHGSSTTPSWTFYVNKSGDIGAVVSDTK